MRGGGRQTGCFLYEPSWLDHRERFALEPALALSDRPFHAVSGKSLFGAISDSVPDRWGRHLMQRADRRDARRENRAPRALLEVDALLRVDDETRQGALRFSDAPGGPYLAEPAVGRVPPLFELPRLLQAADQVATVDDDDSLRLILEAGSSLGGARPKASIRDSSGRLAMAKFPHPQDHMDLVRWERVALSLTRKAGIGVPD